MYEKLVAMVKKLHERTQSGAVEWEPTAVDGIFQASFPQYSVQIRRLPTRHADEGFDYVLCIFNDQGSLVEEIDDVELRDHVEEAWKVMRELYEGARGKAMGVDDAIEKILGELTKDDIPF